MNWTGIFAGLAMLVFTGVFHPVIVKCEYYFSSRVWPVFLVSGLGCCVWSALTESDELSGVLGVLGCILLWCIRELKEQERRVAKGWFPRNPEREIKRDIIA